jgi:hypothetical protein
MVGFWTVTMEYSFIAFFVFYFGVSFACECLEKGRNFWLHTIAGEIREKGK